MKIAIYTAIFGKYDKLKEPLFTTPDCDYFCFTDQDCFSSNVWKIIKLPNVENPSIENRRIKLLAAFNELKDYQYLLYVDGTIIIKNDLTKWLVNNINKKSPIVNFKHPGVSCFYDEIVRCITSGKGIRDKLFEQYVLYKKMGVPNKYGMSDNKIFLINKDSEKCKELFSLWFENVVKYSKRDQTCLSYVLYSLNLSYCYFEEDLNYNKFFFVMPHLTDSLFSRVYAVFRLYIDRIGLGSLLPILFKISNSIKR